MRKKRSKKVITDTEAERERMMENLWGTRQGEIKDRFTFEKAFNDYFLSGVGHMDNKQAVMDDMFRRMQDKFGNDGKRISPDYLFTDAGGKDFERDKQKQSGKIVVSAEEYIKLGSQKADLAGYDTPKEFVFLGDQKGSKRYARVINTKRGLRFIDRKGRYVRVPEDTSPQPYAGEKFLG